MKLYIDFDGTIVDTIKRICDIYNEDYSFYNGFTPVHPDEIQTWDFDELKLSNRKAINQYFNQPRFFNEGLEDMFHACDVINQLHDDGHTIIVVSTGSVPNLRLKKAWLKNHIAFDEFIGVDIGTYKNKDHINMKGGVFIDDMTNNLKGSNAMRKICFGHEYEWNKDWRGERCSSWDNIIELLNKEEA